MGEDFFDLGFGAKGVETEGCGMDFVGDANGFVEVGDGEDGEEGPEGFVFYEGVGWGGNLDDGGFDEERCFVHGAA